MTEFITFQRLSMRLVAIACVAVTAVTVHAAPNAKFNFSYRFRGERLIQPLQAFDNGVNTFFQFRDNNRNVPTIIAEANGQEYVANWSTYGPYIVVPGVASAYRLRSQSLEAQVIQSGVQATVAVPTPVNPAAAEPALAVVPGPGGVKPAVPRYVAFGPVNPIAGGAPASIRDPQAAVAPTEAKTFRVPFSVDSDKLSPAAMKVISEALRGGSEVANVIVVGRDDRNYKEGIAAGRAQNIATALARYGVQEGRISKRVGIPREEEAANKPTSDLVIRFVQRQPEAIVQTASANQGGETSSFGAAVLAVNLVKQGLGTLVQLGYLEKGRADAALEVIVRGMPGDLAQQGQPRALAQKAPATVPVAAMAVVQENWQMTSDDGTFQGALTKWVAKAGWTLDWRASVDYPILPAHPINVRGDAKTAVEHVVNMTKKLARPLSWRLEGNKLVIEG